MLSIQLPYDRLKTAHTVYSPEHQWYSLNLPTDNTGALDKIDSGDQWLFLASLCAALFFRYSNQDVIPLDIKVSLPGELEVPQTSVQIQTSAEMSIGDLMKQMKGLLVKKGQQTEEVAGVSEGAVSIGEDVSCLPVSLCFFGEGDAHSGFLVGGSEEGTPSDLRFVFVKEEQKVHVSITYDSSLFKKKTVTRLVGHLASLAESGWVRPYAPLSELTLLTDQEEAWLVENCQGGCRVQSEQPLFTEIERHAELNPDETAVQFEEGSLSYAALNQRVNQLAYYLTALGVKSEDRVIVFLEPCLDIPVAVLAIFKCGGTYVPLDPSYPEYRIQMLLEETDPVLVITHSKLKTALQKSGVDSVVLDLEGQSIAEQPVTNLNIVINNDQVAYIYYTSGTTGKPKGILASHANLIHYVRVAEKEYGFRSDDIMPAIARFTFSISMFELITPLVAGATLRVLSRQHILNPKLMVETLKSVTVVHAGPSLLKPLVHYIKEQLTDYAVFSSLRHLSSGGDMIPPELLRDLQELFPRTELYVIYGCSEISCMGCSYLISHEKQVVTTYVGKPFDNVAVRLVDESGNLVPVGVIGDVCVGGDGVVKGYLNRPELVEEKFFILDNQRFYRTGDRGRLSSKGDLELLGRLDFQVQLRGMRIELGEVEYHLRNAPGVKEGVVAASDSHSGENALVAFYVADREVEGGAGAIRRFIVDHLPDYMIPRYYVALDALPLNHNMKIDRNALPQVAFSGSTNARVPRTKTESKLAALWLELLKIESVGLDDNFLMIGGDSLQAMEFIIRTESELGVLLDGMDILRESLEVLAKICDASLHGSQEPLPAAVADRSAASCAIESTINPLYSFYFGDNSELYGVFHPSTSQSVGRSVLICPPLGSEYQRCYFFLKMLSELWADAGFNVLRFDYFGTGDSWGNDDQASVARWNRDIAQAYQELSSRVKKTKITVLGVRLGGTMAVHSLKEMEVDRFILWDPVLNGRQHYLKLRGMHAKIIRILHVVRNWRKPEPIPNAEELVGFIYSDETIDQLTDLRIDENTVVPTQKVSQMITANQHAFENAGGKIVVANEFNCNWYHPSKVYEIIKDKRLSDKLMQILQE